MMGQSQSSSLADAAMAPPGITVGPGFPLSLPYSVMSSAPEMYLHEANSSLRSTARSLVLVYEPENEDCLESSRVEGPNLCIFQFLCTDDRKQCYRLCRKQCYQWIFVEGQSRHRLSLKEQSKFVYLEILHIERPPECTNLGMVLFVGGVGNYCWGRWYGCGN